MNIEETKTLLNKISLSYPYAFNNKDKAEKVEILNQWNESLKNCSFNDAMERLNKFVSTSKYSPTIADILGTKTKTSFDNYSNNTSNDNPYGLTDYDKQIIQANYEKYHKYVEMSDDEFNKFLRDEK